MPLNSKKLSAKAARMSADAATVIPIRCALIAKGGEAAMAEAQLMLSEKAEAYAHVSWSVMTGAYGFTPDSVARGILGHYAACVKANRRRLTSKAGTQKRKAK